MASETTGLTGGRWVGQWWMGPKGGIAGVSLSRPPANIAAFNFITRNRLIPISTQLKSTSTEQAYTD